MPCCPTPTRQKKLRLLDLHLDGAVAAEVFRARDAALDAQIRDLEARCAAAQTAWHPDPEAVRRALDRALCFAGGAMLDVIVSQMIPRAVCAGRLRQGPLVVLGGFLIMAVAAALF